MTTRTFLRVGLLSAAVFFAAGATAPGPAMAQERPGAPVEYTVRSGDTLFSISRRFETTVDALKQANGLSGDAIQVGQLLLIPRGTTDAEPVPPPEVDETTQPIDSVLAPPGAPDVDMVPRVDSVDVERRATVPDTVAHRPDTLAAGDDVPFEAADRIEVASGDSSSADTAIVAVEMGFLEVNAARTLYEIAFATGLSVDSLAALNPELPGFFPDSARVVVPAAYAATRYVVRSGDTLFKIARQFETTVAAIRATNSLTSDLIHVGQQLTVPSTRVAAAPSDTSLPLIGQGEARVYPDRFAGRLTAGGRPYDPAEFTVSHRDLPIGSLVLLIGPGGSRNTFAEVTDRLPGSAEYLLDASRAVMNVLGADEGNIDVEVRVVRFGTHNN
ncbi:MAG: LysM peptidoglycan-binding domain-containing protein [Rhodothermales bacterium]|nr:LysM peptidoglycan-binding domain-containing protein [Rhodothermales bacterium]